MTELQGTQITDPRTQISYPVLRQGTQLGDPRTQIGDRESENDAKEGKD